MKIFTLFIFIILHIYPLKAQNTHAYDYILEAIPYIHSNKSFEALEILQKAQKEIDQSFSYQDQFLLWNNTGLVYFKMNDYKEATRYYHKAYELAQNEHQETDVMTILNNLAVLHVKINDKPQAKIYFEEALSLSKKNKIIEKTGIYLVNLSSIFYELGEIKQSKELLNDFFSLSKEQINERTLLNASIVANNISVKEGNYDFAVIELKKLLRKTEQEVYIDERLKIILSIALAYRDAHDIQNSTYYALQGIRQTKESSYLIDFYDLLSKNSLDNADYRNAFSYKDSLLLHQKNFLKTTNDQTIENVQLKFKLTKAQLEKESEKRLHQQTKSYSILLILFILLLVALILFIVHKRNQTIQQKQLLINKNLRIKELELKQVQIQQNLLNETLIKYEDQNKKVLKELATLEEKHEEDSSLHEKIRINTSIYHQTTKELLKELLNEISDCYTEKTKDQLLILTQKIRNHLSLEDQLEAQLLNDFQNISLKIKHFHPELTTQDLRLLHLIYLDIETKEIAKILYISPEGVRKRKERLKNKLKLEKTQHLKEFILKFQ